MNRPILVLQYLDRRKGRTVAVASTSRPSTLQQFKETVLEEARLETLDWEADDFIRVRNQSELARLESLLDTLIPDRRDGSEVD